MSSLAAALAGAAERLSRNPPTIPAAAIFSA